MERFSRARWRRLQAALLVVVLATMGVLAVRADGFAVKKLDLHDTGIWISNDADGYYGRLNKLALGLDATAGPPGQRLPRYELDILQDGFLVAGWDRSGGKLTALNSTTVKNDVDTAVSLPAGTQVQLRGGTLAAMDRSGKVWATRYRQTDQLLNVRGLDPAQEPLADLELAPESPEGSASLTVGADGTVWAGSVSGQAVKIAAAVDGFAKASEVQVTQAVLRTIQLAAVGTSLVALDAETGTVFLEGGRTASVAPDPQAKLQESGPAAAGVLVATSQDFDRVELASGAVTRIDSAGDGAPARPVRLGGCDFAAWAGAGHYARACEGRALESAVVDRSGGLTRPVWRLNHGLITLNDMANGRAFDPDVKSSLDNWKDVRPQAQDQKSQTTREVNQADAKPKAVDDNVKARPDRTRVLHVLDNDTDGAGGILMVKGVSGVAPNVTVDIAPDGQSLKLLLPTGVQATTFGYTITNGVNESEGKVKVTNAGTSNSAPHPREGLATPAYTVASFGNLSIPVAGDWRDDEGDPIAVTVARDGDAVVPVTADGRLEYTAGAAEKATMHTLAYEVTDGGPGKPASGVVNVNVLARSDSRSTPPIAQPDTAQGEVGKPVTVQPLANDTPGADPRNTQARLVLGQPVSTKPDLDVQTDLKSGRVVVTGGRVGTYFLEYQAGYGSSAFATGTVRVDITAAGSSAGPVAMPDQAAVRGQGAVMVDVLANDYDPAGALLTVQSVTPQNPDQVQAAIIAGRWLRIVPLVDTFAPNPQQVVRYSLSNGAQSASGDVVVTQLPGTTDDQPLVRDDAATVRDGDSTLIPVLANDTSLTGAPLSLSTNIQGVDAAGQLRVIDPARRADEAQGDVGTAFVHANQIRYVAPARVETSRQVQVEYVALTASGNTGVGHVAVTINPQPASPEANQAPVPQPVEMRLVSGSRVAIPIPTSAADPDGDSVTVTGITSAPTLGRVVGLSPSSITYEAYPTAGLVGTDTFSYEVTDRYGRTGQAGVRVAVVAPGQTQPPVALDDTVIARPNAPVQVNVLANDLVNRDDVVTVAPLASLNDALPADVRLADEKGPVVVTSPAPDGQPLVLLYALAGNGGTGPSASVKVTSRADYRNPPVIADQTATVDGEVARVDVLATAWDPDGEASALRVDLLATPEGATVAGGTVTVPLLAQPQVIPFKVTDAEGATNGAVIYVPAAGSGAPTLNPGGLVEVGQNQAVTVALADHVMSPRGKVVRIAAGNLAASPAGSLAAAAVDADTFTVTASNDYVGPGAVVLEVMDAPSLTDPDVLTATISIPVQVGPRTPVLRCPTEPQTIVQGGEARSLDITSLCHVWSPDPDSLGTLTYSATWAKPLADVSAQPGRKVAIQAGSNAVGKATGTLTVGIEGTPAKTAELQVSVIEAARPTMTSKTLTDIKQGTPVPVQLGLKSPFVKPEPTIVGHRQLSGPTATVVENGMALVITPDASLSGTIVVEVTASDLADKARTDRHVTRTVTLVVYGKPDAPAAPQPGESVQSRSWGLSWAPPKSNGAPIDQYKVVGDNGKEWTFQSTSGNVTGLTNDVPVRFQVLAHNKGGWSEPSPLSDAVRPDELPGAVTGVTASNPQDGSLTLTWGAPSNGGSALQAINITWQGGSQQAAAGATTATLTGLDNNTKYTFTVWAENKLGPGPNASGSGQSSGKPLGLSVNTPAPSASVGAATPVRVSWAAANANGPGPVTYSVQRSDGKQICSNATATSCTDDTVTFDGATYSYTVTAVNATGEPHSATATSAQWKATGTPDAWGSWSAEATGQDGQVRLTYTVPPSRGASSTLTLQGAAGTLASVGPAGGAGSTTLAGLTDGTSYNLTLKVCNDNDKCSVSTQKSVTPFGPLGSPNVSFTGLSGSGGNFTATFQVSVPGNNGGPATVNITSDRSCSGAGSLNVGSVGNQTFNVSCSLGWSSTASVSASFVTGTTTPSRGDGGSAGPVVSTRTADEPALPPPVSSLTGTVSGLTVTFTVRNFNGAGRREIRCWNADGGGHRWPNASTGDPGNYLGTAGFVNIPSDGTVSVSCAGNELQPSMRPNGNFHIEVYGNAYYPIALA